MKNKKAILIADSDKWPYNRLKEFVHPSTWNNELWNDYDIYYMKGKEINFLTSKKHDLIEFLRFSKLGIAVRINEYILLNVIRKILRKNKPSVTLRNNEILVDIPEGLRYLGYKYLASLKYLYSQNYDLVIKTTSSSLFNKKVLDKFLEKLNVENDCIYCGSVINFGASAFASGANLILSRKAIKLLISNEKYWDHSVLDDVAIGKIMRNQGIEITNLTTMNISSMQILDQLNENKSKLSEIVHFRCRTYTKPRTDAEILLRLNKLIESFSKF